MYCTFSDNNNEDRFGVTEHDFRNTEGNKNAASAMIPPSMGDSAHGSMGMESKELCTDILILVLLLL